jgi:hypothetical protein
MNKKLIIIAIIIVIIVITIYFATRKKKPVNEVGNINTGTLSDKDIKDLSDSLHDGLYMLFGATDGVKIRNAAHIIKTKDDLNRLIAQYQSDYKINILIDMSNNMSSLLSNVPFIVTGGVALYQEIIDYWNGLK